MSSRDIANLKNGLVAAWIPSLGSTGYRLIDRVGSNHGVLTGMDAGSDWVVSGGGLSLDFDGSNDYIAFRPIAPALGFSFCAWFKAGSVSKVRHSIFANSDDVSPDVYLHLEQVSGSTYAMNFYNGSGYLGVSSSFTLDTEWHHYAWVTNLSGTVSYYRDGMSLSNAGTAWTVNNDNSSTATIGGIVALIGLGFTAQGQIDDCRRYSRPLSATEVSLLSKERGIGFKTSSRTSSVFAKRYAYKPPKDKTYAAITRSQSDYDSLREGLVLAICPSVSGATGYRAVDVSGRGNHGTLTNMTSEDWVVSGGASSLDFDGVDDHVLWTSVPSSFYTMPFSISLWASCNQVTENDAVFALANSANNNQLFSIAFRGDVSGDPIYAQMRGSDSASNTFASYFGYTASTRYHICAVFRSASYRQIYVNGIAGTEDTTAHTVEAIDRMAIGRLERLNPAIPFSGTVDDIRIYSRALTPAEIRQLASRRGIGLQPRPKQFTYSQIATSSKRRRLLTGMP